MPSDAAYGWECPECGADNEIDPAVVEFCKELWTSCEECGERWSFNLAGEP